MDVECNLMAGNTPRHVTPFILNKMLKLKSSKTICDHDVQVENNLIFIFQTKNALFNRVQGNFKLKNAIVK